MRFLIGLISGAAVILLLAQTLNAPDGQWTQRLKDAVLEFVGTARQGFSTDDAVEEPSAPGQEPAGVRPALPEDLAVTEEPALQPIPRPPDPLPLALSEDTQRIVAEVFETPAAPIAAPRSETVWVPFRSAMSASGFAERLSASLDHPFEVERRGPGRYEVVFDYRDELQRRELLDQAARATGLPL